MRNEICICSAIPQLKIQSKLILVIGKREIKVPTNTGRLAAMALPPPSSSILIHGEEGKPYDLSEHLLGDRPSLLLYPSEDAIELSSELAQSLGPINLIVPDGNWRQTSKMRRRNPLMAQLPTIRLPLGAPSAYQVRRETKAEGLATLEAIARVLGFFEGPEIQRALEELMALMVARTLHSREGGGFQP